MLTFKIQKQLELEWYDHISLCGVSRFEIRTRLAESYESFQKIAFRTPEYFMHFTVPINSEIAKVAHGVQTEPWRSMNERPYIKVWFDEGIINAVLLGAEIEHYNYDLYGEPYLRLRTALYLKSGLDAFSVPNNGEWLITESSFDTLSIVPKLAPTRKTLI